MKVVDALMDLLKLVDALRLSTLHFDILGNKGEDV